MSAASNQSLQRSASYQELARALEEKTGCPICAIAQEQARTHIGGLLWDSVNDPTSRDRLDASLGMCGRHSREMLNFTGERLAITIVQQAVVKEALRQLHSAPPPPRQSWSDRLGLKQLWRALRGQPTPRASTLPSPGVESPASHADQPTQSGRCPACMVETRTEDRVAQVLNQHLAGDLDARLRHVGGLCRPHLYFCLSRADSTQHAALLELHEALWAELEGNLGEFIRKRDHRFSHETVTDAERDAVERSIRIITGGDPFYPPREKRRR